MPIGKNRIEKRSGKGKRSTKIETIKKSCTHIIFVIIKHIVVVLIIVIIELIVANLGVVFECLAREIVDCAGDDLRYVG